MLKVSFVASLAERDVDLVLLEELSVSDEFCDWFAARVEGIPIFKSRIGAWHSVCHPSLGESDLVFIFNSEDGQEMAILVENKIDARPQPDQGKRYQLRGKEGQLAKDWGDFRTCLVAPAQYLESPTQSEIYDAEISYEEIVAFLSSRRFRDERYRYKARVLQEAVEQNRRGYQATVSDEMTQFAKEYVALSSRDFPQLSVQQAKPRAPGNTWMSFYPRPFPTGSELYHQLAAGYAKVMFTGRADQLDAIREKYASRLTDDVEIALAGTKSVSIAIKVPKIDPIKLSFESQQDKAIQGMQAILRLVTLVRGAEGMS